MQELISVITAATEKDATKEQREAGVAACRAILTALDTEPGQPLVIPTAAPVQAVPRVSLDQVLDLMIARLSMLATEREQNVATPATPTPVVARAASASPGFRVPMVPAVSTARTPAIARAIASKTAPTRAIAARSPARRKS